MYTYNMNTKNTRLYDCTFMMYAYPLALFIKTNEMKQTKYNINKWAELIHTHTHTHTHTQRHTLKQTDRDKHTLALNIWIYLRLTFVRTRELTLRLCVNFVNSFWRPILHEQIVLLTSR